MRQTTVNLLILLVITLLAAWFFYTHEKVTETEYVGYSGEARYNDFLAAQLLLQHAGIEADSVSTLTPSNWLPDYGDTIVSRLTATIAVSDEQSELFDWVSYGGHLVLMPPTEETQVTSKFLREINVSLITLEYDPGEDEEELDEDDAEEEESFDYIVDLDGTRQRIELLDEDAFGATLSDDKGVIAARRIWGDGTITIVADSTYFLNWSLDEYDHARLLLDTLAGYVDPGTVWFVLDAAFPSLWAVLWNNLTYVVIAAVVTLMLWLWSVMPRFGPAIKPPSEDRRSILEHVAAAGHFAWRHHGTSKLADSSVRALLHEAELRQPGLRHMPVGKQAQHLARLSDVPPQTVFDLLTRHDDSRHREFTHNVQNLQRVRKHL